MNESALKIEDLTAGYVSNRPVLRGLSLTLGASETVGICGANGSGKSTLAAAIMGLIDPLAGRIAVLGRTIDGPDDVAFVRQTVGYLFQDCDDQLFSPTVAEDVAFGPLNLGVSRAAARSIVAETLAQVGLDGYEERVTYRLSGGEKQLAALACVLAMRPKILLLDEPDRELDERSLARVEKIVADFAGAVLVISHARSFLKKNTDRIVILENGVLVPVPPDF